jgi:hypothetical protein
VKINHADLDEKTRQAITKLATSRLKLVKLGYDEDSLAELERSDLIPSYAQAIASRKAEAKAGPSSQPHIGYDVQLENLRISAEMQRHADLMANEKQKPAMQQQRLESLHGSHWTSTLGCWGMIWVPTDLQAILLNPHLTVTARSMLTCVDQYEVNNFGKVKELLLAQFKPTPQSYRTRFNNVVKQQDESHVLYTNKLHLLLQQYINAETLATVFKNYSLN